MGPPASSHPKSGSRRRNAMDTLVTFVSVVCTAITAALENVTRFLDWYFCRGIEPVCLHQRAGARHRAVTVLIRFVVVVGVVLGVISVAVPHLRATSGLVRTLSPEEARLIDGALGIVDTAMHDPRTLHGDGDGEDGGTSDRTLALFEQRRRGSLHDSGGEEEEARRESAAG
eukprot:CAMPEP_0181381364 /NCGR_PEP_ID=MMETSP1106-20121128/20081_1 /TAXON_ID=81844 /ORGANISM="Mantoniella antarctica, Strain SL-175" /LENGTH=171 /DNA_ID=CAMNT_0023500541 /DNA_START=168 /DNA_END=680 /DNA_ORIENTATION=+